MDSPDTYARQADGYKAQLDHARAETLRRRDLITAAKESAYRNPAARELILGDARILQAEIEALERQIVILDKLVARCRELARRAQECLPGGSWRP